jgi:phosphatidylglycerol lysyltransferase
MRVSELDKARRIVLAHGWNSTSYQILNPGIQHWFADSGDGVTGYVPSPKVMVAGGAPVCAKERLKEVAAEFERDAARKKKRVCYFGAEARLEKIYENSAKHAKVLLGAQPVWQPKNWADIIANYKSLRAQLNRAKNKGVTVTEWSAEKAQDNAALIETLDEWLSSKGLPPLSFMVEPNTLSRLSDRRVFVAELYEKVIGFVILSPVATRNGWLFEQFVHRPDSPNGTVELMIDAAMRALAEDDYEYATLGLSPLSVRAEIKPFDNPLWLRIVLAWLRKHAQRFYNFEGLDAFKSKLQPEEWEPVFAISNEPKFSPSTLYSILYAFSGNAPFKLVLGGLWRAFITEIKWLKQGFNNKFTKPKIV